MYPERYNFDEALRLTQVTMMYEGHTYVFRVSNIGGRFMLMLERHLIPTSSTPCKHVGEGRGDPCAETGKDLKQVAYECIEKHLKLCHYLKSVN